MLSDSQSTLWVMNPRVRNRGAVRTLFITACGWMRVLGRGTQPEAATTELLLEHAVLLDQVLDDVLLLDVDPAGERQEKDSQRVGVGRHRAIVVTG